MAMAIPVAIAIFLFSASWHRTYTGDIVSWRPLQGARSSELVARYLVLRPTGSAVEATLPRAALRMVPLPRNDRALPPEDLPAYAVPVQKKPLTLTVSIDGKAWPTVSGSHLLLPLLFLIAVALGRNLFVTGSVFKVTATKGNNLIGVKQPESGQVTPPKQPKARGKGPPGNRGKGRRRAKRPR